MSKTTLFKGINVVVDTLWGDSGKGKIVDIGAQHVDMVVRYAGGSNAGHTIKNEKGEFKLHLIPSGIFNPNVLNVIDSGVVLNPASLVEEFEAILKQGVKISNKQLLISNRAHVVMPWHLLRDQPKKAKTLSNKIDTTGRGIGPTYSDKTARSGLRVRDLFRPNFSDLIREECKNQNEILKHLYGLKPVRETEVLKFVAKFRKIFRSYIGDSFSVIQEYKSKKKNILGEGAQGALLDIYLGGFPFVTSSHPTVGGFSVSTGIQDIDIKNVIGVTKAYATRVGSGPMPTELINHEGERLREIGKEYGATTGRPRRCGWFDLPATRYGALISGTRSVALTKLDVLDSLKTIKVCVSYKMNRKVVALPPDMDPDTIANAQPIYQTLPGWNSSTSNIKSFDKLPLNARRYIQYLEKQLGLPVIIVSIGADRNQTILR